MSNMRDPLLKSLPVIMLIAPGFTLSVDKNENREPITDKLIALPQGSVRISGFLGSISVQIDINTDYPVNEDIEIIINPEKKGDSHTYSQDPFIQ